MKHEYLTVKELAGLVGRREEEIFRCIKDILENLGDDYFTNEQLLNMLRNTRSRYVAEYAMRMLMRRGITPGKKH
jgi:hypothetical protein